MPSKETVMKDNKRSESVVSDRPIPRSNQCDK